MEMCICDKPKLRKTDGGTVCDVCGFWHDQKIWEEDRAYLSRIANGGVQMKGLAPKTTAKTMTRNHAKAQRRKRRRK